MGLPYHDRVPQVCWYRLADKDDPGIAWKKKDVLHHFGQGIMGKTVCDRMIFCLCLVYESNQFQPQQLSKCCKEKSSQIIEKSTQTIGKSTQTIEKSTQIILESHFRF